MAHSKMIAIEVSEVVILAIFLWIIVIASLSLNKINAINAPATTYRSLSQTVCVVSIVFAALGLLAFALYYGRQNAQGKRALRRAARGENVSVISEKNVIAKYFNSDYGDSPNLYTLARWLGLNTVTDSFYTENYERSMYAVDEVLVDIRGKIAIAMENSQYEELVKSIRKRTEKTGEKYNKDVRLLLENTPLPETLFINDREIRETAYRRLGSRNVPSRLTEAEAEKYEKLYQEEIEKAKAMAALKQDALYYIFVRASDEDITTRILRRDPLNPQLTYVILLAKSIVRKKVTKGQVFVN